MNFIPSSLHNPNPSTPPFANLCNDNLMCTSTQQKNNGEYDWILEEQNNDSDWKGHLVTKTPILYAHANGNIIMP
jgi:hypothetical protein